MIISEKYPGVCFTGHRGCTAGERALLAKRLPALLRRLVTEHGTCDFYAGGALGFDTAAAQAVLELKKEFPDVRLNLILPCGDQCRRWPEEAREEYHRIARAADSATVITPFYYNGCMLVRDRALVDAADLCVCAMRPGSEAGGTAYTVRYALRQGIPVVNLLADPFDAR